MGFPTLFDGLLHIVFVAACCAVSEAAVDPKTLFADNKAFGKFDESGFPLTDSDGNELPKSQVIIAHTQIILSPHTISVHTRSRAQFTHGLVLNSSAFDSYALIHTR